MTETTSAVIYTLIAGLLNAIMSQLFCKQPGDKGQCGGFMVAFGLTNIAIAAVLISFNGYHPGSGWFAGISTASGLFTLVNLFAVFAALKKGPLSILWPFAWLAAPLSGIIWFIYTGFEGFSVFHAAGIIFFLIALVLMYFSNKADSSVQPGFFMLAVIALLGGTAATLLYKYDLTTPPFAKGTDVTYMFFSAMATNVVITCNAVFTTQRISYALRPVFYACLAGVVGMLQFYLATFAVARLDASVYLCTFAGSAIFFSTFFARVFQKEELTALKIASTAAILAAIAMLSFTVTK